MLDGRFGLFATPDTKGGNRSFAASASQKFAKVEADIQATSEPDVTLRCREATSGHCIGIEKRNLSWVQQVFHNPQRQSILVPVSESQGKVCGG
jgi:hypothetical protein